MEIGKDMGREKDSGPQREKGIEGRQAEMCIEQY
jgi:hypothetical protein